MSLLLLFLPTSSRANRATARAARPAVSRVTRLACALVFVVVCAGGAAAIPLDEYRSRIHEALTGLNAMWEAAEEGTDTADQYIKKRTATYAKIRQLVP